MATIKQDRAVYWTGKLSRGGRLVWRTDELVFEPNLLERAFRAQRVQIPLGEVRSVCVTQCPFDLLTFLPLPKWLLAAAFIIGFPATFVGVLVFYALRNQPWLLVKTDTGDFVFGH